MNTSVTSRSERLVRWLSNPASHSSRTTTVEVVETHISWVFLTRLHAYKLKKPVRFDFLDFSTAELRHRACEDEVRLNGRLATSVYMGVIPVVEDAAGHFHLGNHDTAGEPVDWLVQMRRLPAERAMDALIRAEALSGFDLERVAATLSDFYRRAVPVPMAPEDYLRGIEQHVRSNRGELLKPEHGLPPLPIKRIHAAQLRVLKTSSELLNRRAEQGRIVEGHGDLRPEHIYLPAEGRPVVIDCVEFNRDLRTVDVVDELSFLAMECDALGTRAGGPPPDGDDVPGLADRPAESLVRFYKAYRACIRAKVIALTAGQLRSGDEKLLAQANRYLQLAAEYAAPWDSPWLIVVGGLMGTGKSTLAAALAEALGTELLSTDPIRRNYLAPATSRPSLAPGSIARRIASGSTKQCCCARTPLGRWPIRGPRRHVRRSRPAPSSHGPCQSPGSSPLRCAANVLTTWP